jgi:hypothetical protein
MATEQTTCCKSKPILTIDKKPSKKGGFLSFISAALIILLPKCPFCIAAYSGALVMFYEVDSSSLAPIFTHLKPLLGLFVLTSILLNFKGRKSKVAVVITAVAFTLLLLEVYLNMHLIPTWIIYLGFFLGAWYNGNFVHFYRFLKSKKNNAVERADA